MSLPVPDVGVNRRDRRSASVSRDDDVTRESSSDDLKAHSERVPQYSRKLRWMKTFALGSSNLGIGFLATIIGNTMLHLGLIFHVSTTVLSTALMTETVGFLVGVMFIGSVIDRLEFEFVVASSTLVTGLANICAPFFGFGVFVTMLAVKGVAAGCCLTITSLFSVDTWHGTRYRDMALQLQTAAFSAGAAVAPFVIKLFLVDLLPYRVVGNATIVTSTSPHYQLTSSTAFVSTAVTEVTVIPESNATTEFVDGVGRLADVRFAYVVLGLTTCVSSLPAMVLYCYRGLPRPCLRSSRRTTGSLPVHSVPSSQTVTQTSSCALKIFYVCFLFIIGSVYTVQEVAPRGYLTPFASKQLSWTIADAAAITSVFYGSNCFGRIIGVLVSTFISPGTMLTGNLIVTAIGLAGLLTITAGLVATQSSTAVWALTAVTGIGQSTIGGSLLLLLFDDFLVVSLTTTAAVLGVGGCVGAACTVVAIGYLLDEVSPLWVIYIPFIALGFLLLLLVVRRLLTMTSYAKNLRRLTTNISETSVIGGTDNIAAYSARADERTPLLAA